MGSTLSCYNLTKITLKHSYRAIRKLYGHHLTSNMQHTEIKCIAIQGTEAFKKELRSWPMWCWRRQYSLNRKKRLLNFLISRSCLEKQPSRESSQQKQETFWLWHSILTTNTAICKSPMRTKNSPQAKVQTIS